MKPHSPFILRWLIRMLYAVIFGGVFVFYSQPGISQVRESRRQKLDAIRAAGLYQNVARTPAGSGRVCNPTSNPCSNGLRCVHINVTYRDGSAPFSTFRCENQFCPPAFITLMIDGNTDKTSQELITSLHDGDDGQVDIEMQCPAVNLWDPASPNHGIR